MRKTKKKERQDSLLGYLENHPFATDEELSDKLKVSIQTIRLDRLALGIPQVRERVKNMAEIAYASPRSLDKSEIIGDLIDVDLNSGGISILEISQEMILTRTKIARGHFLFAQANSLAIAIIDAEIVLTAAAEVRFRRPVYLDEKIIAKAKVTGKSANKYLVEINSYVNEELVFNGLLTVSVVSEGREDAE